MTLTVDNPILNSPYREPERYWLYDAAGMPRIENGRRRAGYYFRARARAGERQLSFLSDEQFDELGLVNRIRAQVRDWRAAGYPGATPVTRQLLAHWNNPDRERRLFFCQLEAAETVIWLMEIRGDRKLGIDIPPDTPLDGASKPLTRYAVKMATGSGKTVVMAMLMAWSFVNKALNPQDRRFSDGILIVTPNLTVKERLGGGGSGERERGSEGDTESEDADEDGQARAVLAAAREPERPLVPGARGNYFERFDLVPAMLLPYLGQGRVLITNWQTLAVRDDGGKRQVMQRGQESPTAFANRVLRDLGGKKNLLVINDEAHHAYRPAPYDDDRRPDGMSAEEWAELKAAKEEATVWVSGLDAIHSARRINVVLDLSATPFYIQGSGYPEGSPLPWIVSDFGLVDAIECGIVKIPRVPVADDTGQPIPKYFRLWQAVNEALPAKDRATRGRKPKPEAVVREAEGALQALAGEWQATLARWQQDNYPVPPVLIAVCDNTDIAEYLYEKIAVEGAVFPELLKNEPGAEHTIRIDSKLLASAEAGGEGGGSRAELAEALRRKVATVGKPGEPGEQVRCVVSVGMLTEGWDAQNVTQVFGLRAFQSQLLCEQVVGRGLRRMNYDFEVDENGVPQNEEYVDIYGIPFEVIPTKKKPAGAPAPLKESFLVKALAEREALKIEFPRVEGFVWQVRSRIVADVDAIPVLTIEPGKEPTETISVARVGYHTAFSLNAPGEALLTTRAAFYAENRPQRVEYLVASRVTEALLAHERFKFHARQLLFPQVLGIVRAYLERRVVYSGMDKRELGLEKYVQLIVERLADAIRPADEAGASLLLPRIERFRPRGSTEEVLFRTTRPVRATVKSHISHVVLDTATWEASAAFHLETSPRVAAYARTDHMGFAIPYTYAGAGHNFFPDFLVRLADGATLVLEVKGYEDEQDRAKYAAARRWCEAVTNWGQMGRWVFDHCAGPGSVRAVLARHGQ